MSIDEARIFVFVKALILDIRDIPPSQLHMSSSLASLALDRRDYVDFELRIRKKYGVNLAPALFASEGITTMRELATRIFHEAHTRETVSG
jgi:hypothetical protein